MRQADLRQRCDVFEASVRRRGLATLGELAAIRPGGTGNTSRGLGGTIRWYGQLCALLAREERPDTLQDFADNEAAAALLERPRTVELPPPPGSPAGTAPRTFTLYAKSFEALLDCEGRDRVLEALSFRYDVLRRIPATEARAEDLALQDRCQAELVHQYASLVWIATTEGPGLPYDPRLAAAAEPPAVLRALEPVELLVIAQGFWKLHAGAMPILRLLVHPRKGSEPSPRPSFAQFFPLAGKQLNTDPRTLMRDRSLISVLFSAVLASPPPPDREPATAPAGADVGEDG